MTLRTRLTELLGIEYPIIQGGLAYLALADLAAAVSAAGGLGQITATTLPSAEALRAEIAKVRRLTSRPFSVNFAISERREIVTLVEAALEEGVPVMSFTAGNPEPYFRLIGDAPVKKMVLVAGVRQARKVEELGGDVVIAVGQEGGGHIGRDDLGTFVLVPRIVESVSIPVVASGGVGTGRQLAAALALGAEGIEMGTRFVATRECTAHPNYKEALVRARETDTTVIERSIGRPGRVLKGPTADKILEAEARGATVEELLPLISGQVNLLAADQGDLNAGWVWAGQVVGLIDDVPTCQELVERIVAEARAAGRRICPALTTDEGRTTNDERR